MLERLPNEILFEILEYVPDFVSLRNVVLACPVFYRLYPGRFITLFTSILDQIHSRQLRGLVKTVLAVRHNTTTKCSLNARFTYKDFIFTIPDVKGDPLRLEDVVHPLSALCHIAAAYQDLKYFEKSFVASCFSRWGLDQTEERAMSPAEIHRIQRALWTVQLLLETSNAEPPLNSVSILERAGTIDNFPSRHNGSPSSSNENGRLVYGLDLPTETEFCRQRDGIRDYFIYRLTPWELEEVECLFLHLCSQYRILKRRRARVSVRRQRPIVKRLLARFGFGVHMRSPARLEDCRMGGLAKVTPLGLLLHSRLPRSTFERLETSTCDVPGADRPNSGGWESFRIYNRYGHYSDNRMPGHRLWLEPGVLHDWGYCIWDDERLRDWDWFDPDNDRKPNWVVWEAHLTQKLWY